MDLPGTLQTIAGTQVQAVDILRNESESVGKAIFHFYQRPVPLIRQSLAADAPPV